LGDVFCIPCPLSSGKYIDAKYLLDLVPTFLLQRGAIEFVKSDCGPH
jgi:hypothetical protein